MFGLKETTMNRRKKWIASGAIALIVLAAGAGMVLGGGSGGETPLSGTALDRAAAAALESTGGGTVLESEVGDNGAAYSVDVRLGDGTKVEVNLDQNFNVISSQTDEDSVNEGGGDD
jgi:hypothetical protein